MEAQILFATLFARLPQLVIDSAIYPPDIVLRGLSRRHAPCQPQMARISRALGRDERTCRPPATFDRPPS